jgi:hypothetical protein
MRASPSSLNRSRQDHITTMGSPSISKNEAISWIYALHKTHSTIRLALCNRHLAAIRAELLTIAVEDVAATVARLAILLALLLAALAPPLVMVVRRHRCIRQSD